MRRPHTSALILAIGFAAPDISAAQSALDRVRSLAAILGVWETRDVYRPDTPSQSVELGRRTCGYALANRYIECITMGTSAAGREREYRFYITWDEDRERFTMLSFWSNVAGMQLTAFTVDSTGRAWDIRSTAPYVENGVESRTWSTLRWVTPDSIVWTGRINRSTEPPDSWPVTFRETWRRRR